MPDWIHLHEPPRLDLSLLADGSGQLVDPGLLTTVGSRTAACQQLLSGLLDGSPALLTTSCTQALELAALLTGVGPGDEVVVPTFTFPSTANAFVLRGATVRFADIRPDTLNVDEEHLASLCTDRTRALVAVHYAGVACDLDALTNIAADAGVPLVEDAAHALFGSWRGRPLGTIGQFGALSFHRTKNVAVGEGGALLVNDRDQLARAEVLVAKGTDRLAFARGDVDVYTWRDVGTAAAMTELVAALLEPQLREPAPSQEHRSLLWSRYQAALGSWATARGVTLPTVPEHSTTAAHLYWLVLPDPASRERLTRVLAEVCVESTYHYQPLHASPMGRRHGGQPGQCPVAERVAASLLRIPLHAALTEAEQDRVIEAVLAFEP